MLNIPQVIITFDNELWYCGDFVMKVEVEVEPVLWLVRDKRDLDVVKALLKRFHPGGWVRGPLNAVWALCDEGTGGFLAVCIICPPMPAVVEKAKKMYSEWEDIEMMDVLFVRRIMTVPPFSAGGFASMLLLQLEEQYKSAGFKAFYSYVYPGLPGHLYQRAKWKFGWTGARGHRFVYKIIK